MSRRAAALANRIEEGAAALAAFAEALTDTEWNTRVLPDGRTVGVIIHHVASVYPLEIQLARTLADGNPITGVTASAIAEMNAKHAHDHGAVTRSETLDLLRGNSRAAAEAVRGMTDDQLDRAAAVSLNGNAPLTAQFFIEDHALRHSFHHLARLRAAVGR